jgi:cytochrome P450
MTAREIPWLRGGQPVLGHANEMRRGPQAFLTRVRDELGDMARFRVLNRRMILASNPAVIERVLVDNPRSYSKRTAAYDIVRLTVGNGLATSSGDFWLRQRRLAQPAFHREKIAGFAELIKRAVDDAIARMRNNEPFDFAAHMTRLTSRIIGEALFSRDVSDDSDRAGAAIAELARQGVQRTYGIYDPPLWLPTARNQRFRHARAVLDEIVFGVIKARRAGEHKNDLLSMLLDSVDAETGERMDDAQLRDEVVTMFIAGHETTSVLLSWCMHALLDRPELVERCRSDAKFLDATLQETLRLYPPAWQIGRRIEVDDEADGCHLKFGIVLFLLILF